jgi:hypothetical protein
MTTDLSSRFVKHLRQNKHLTQVDDGDATSEQDASVRRQGKLWELTDGLVGAAFREPMQRIFTMTKSRIIISSSCLTRCLLGFAGVLMCSYASAQAQQFSADLVTTHADGMATAAAGKLRVFDNKVRIETPDFADGFFLTDEPNRAAYFARPTERIFMDARQSSRLTQLFVSVDPGDPCRQWQIMANLASGGDQSNQWRCERIGEEIVDGRHAAVYRAISSPEQEFVGWIDPELKFPLRIKMEDGATITVENIQEGTQSARLFVIPTNFQKFDPQALIKRVKQSDVWVNQPPQ